MADQLLSIENSTLTAIANAIRNKGGTSAKLSFPDGMVAALRNIETVATVTPKVSPPSTKELTPSDTSFAIEQGYHTNDTTVIISATTGSATPSSTEVTYYPQSPYSFFSMFWVDGIGNAKQVVTGTITIPNDSTSLTIPNLTFTPVGVAGMTLRSTTVKEYKNLVVAFFKDNDVTSYYNGLNQSSGSSGAPLGDANCQISFSNGQAVASTSGNNRFNGDYLYVVWG